MKDVLASLERSRVVGVLRAATADAALELSHASIRAGLPAIEIAFTTPDAPRVIARLKELHPDLLVGAGTALTEDDLRASAAAGADFAVSPHLERELILAARSIGLPYVPGAFSPSEVAQALSLECPLVKIFPARLGGPSYVRDLRGPFPNLRVMATGGVSIENARSYLDAGVKVVGLGSVFGTTSSATEAATRKLLEQVAG